MNTLPFSLNIFKQLEIFQDIKRLDEQFDLMLFDFKNGAYNNAEVLDHYGDIMFQLDRCKEAVEAWNEAKKYDVNLEEALDEKITWSKNYFISCTGPSGGHL